jgi:hypothetical protein
LKRTLWISALALTVWVIFLPSLYALGWHLRYGNALTYKGKLVPIPGNWIAEAQPQGLTLTRAPATLFGYLGHDWILRWISIYKMPPLKNRPVREVEESFEKGFWTYTPGTTVDAVISGPIRLGVPPNDAFCMKATPTHHPGPISISCLVQNATWHANYMGGEQYVSQFYKMMLGIRDTTPGK